MFMGQVAAIAAKAEMKKKKKKKKNKDKGDLEMYFPLFQKRLHQWLNWARATVCVQREK